MFEPVAKNRAAFGDSEFAKAFAGTLPTGHSSQSTGTANILAISDSPIEHLLRVSGSTLQVTSSSPTSHPLQAKKHTHIPLVEENVLLHRKKKRKRKHHRRRHRNNNNNPHDTSNSAVSGVNSSNNKNKSKRSNLPSPSPDAHSGQGVAEMAKEESHRLHRERHRWLLHEDLCHHALVDTCSWPQCNRSCPRLHNPFTGKLNEPSVLVLLNVF